MKRLSTPGLALLLALASAPPVLASAPRPERPEAARSGAPPAPAPSREAVLTRLRSAEVYLALTPGSAGGGEGDKARVTIRAVALDDGDLAVSLYTSPARLMAALGPDAGFLPLRGEEALRLFGDRPLAIDFGAPGQIVLRPLDEAAPRLDATRP